jgi:hypothetical protein
VPEGEKQKKEEALRVLSESLAQAGRVEAQGREMVETARLYLDVVTPIQVFIKQLPANSLTLDQWDHLNDSTTSWSTNAVGLEKFHGEITLFTASTYAVTTTSNTIVSIVSAGTASVRPEAEAARSQLRQVLARRPLADTALSAMNRLGLDRQQGSKRTPSEFLDEAKAALERPVLPEPTPAAVLIPLRSCVNEIVNELVRRRPEQKPIPKRAKLLSIGAQCGRVGLDDDHFRRLQTNCHRLLNDLADAKQSGMSRDRVSQLFQEGLAFLNALLESIDETRLGS